MKVAIGSVVLAAALLCGCGGSGGGGGGGCTPHPTTSMSVGAGGFTPKAVCVLPSGTVTISNTDTVGHTIDWGASCAQASLSIAAGTSQLVTFTTAEVCNFSDAAHSTDPAFQGVVAVTEASVGGAGY